MLVKAWSESGPKETANSFKYCWMFFVLQKNRGMLPSIELLVFLLNELDVIVFVINRRLLYLWRISVFIVIFPFCGGIKRISALTYDCFSSVVVLLLLYSTNGSCWWIMHVTDIVVSWKLGSNCIVYIETGWCCGFRVNFAEIYLHGLLSCF